jgi:integrase
VPLRYRHVQYRYNKAFKAIGLFPAYSGTHFMRYTMATESRRLMGSLDAAQAITGHHSVKMAEQYAKLPTNLQSETIACVGSSLDECFKKQAELTILPPEK